VDSEGRLTELNKEEATIVKLMRYKGSNGIPAGHHVFIKFKGIVRQVRLAYDEDKERLNNDNT